MPQPRGCTTAFVNYARAGANELEKYALIGWTFPNGGKLSTQDIAEARKILDDLEAGRNGKTFVLDPVLANQ